MTPVTKAFDSNCKNFEILYFKITPKNGWSSVKYIHFSYVVSRERIYEPVHVILLDFLYNLLTYIKKLFILKGRKL